MYQVLHLAALLITIVIKYAGCPPTLKKQDTTQNLKNIMIKLKQICIDICISPNCFNFLHFL